MAIVIEEDKSKQKNGVSFLGLIIVVVILAVAAYFIFFVNPEPASITPPAGLENIDNASQVQVDPAGVTNSPSFQMLKQYISEPTSTGPVSVGRTDPFLIP
jgi:hypothetical protein